MAASVQGVRFTVYGKKPLVLLFFHRLPSTVNRIPFTEFMVLLKAQFVYNNPMSTTAIILAGGTGKRFNHQEPKQFLEIGGKTLLETCLRQFQDHPGIDGIVLVCPAAHLARVRKIVAAGALSKVKRILPGGATRQESSAIGVSAAAGAATVLIHDAARALVPPAVIDRVLAALASERAVMPVLHADDTIVRVANSGLVTAVLDRDKLRRVQTPQGFRLEIIRQGHELAVKEGFADADDDCSLVLRYSLAPVVTVEGDPNNIKITYPFDLIVAEAINRNS
jgi:2-C-methyl-D-erythritol 4-phosphate cytidylyltransferase